MVKKKGVTNEGKEYTEKKCFVVLIPISIYLQKPPVAAGGERIPCLGLEHDLYHPKQNYILLNPLEFTGLEG